MDKFNIIHTANGRVLHITGDLPAGFHGERTSDGYHCPLDHENATAIRRELPWTAPQPVGMRKSIGCGDRLGIATPGHLRAVREGDMFPVLAQQSIREMQRAGRSPADVMDDATWGVLEAGYTGGFGSDADHLKTTDDINACIETGFTGFTLDPGQYVDDAANNDDVETLRQKFALLSWERLDSNGDDNRRLFVEERGFDELTYLRAAAKYGSVIARVAELASHIEQGMSGRDYDLEISVDETATVTTLDEHRYIALELKRLNIPFSGLAPRFVGDFEKGVDYIGDLAVFEESYRQHAAIAKEHGYKLSIHSGSDKFSIYPIIAKHSNPYVHLKTAGTSWLEALRVIAAKDEGLFRNILALAVDGYAENALSYHVSAKPENVSLNLPDNALPSILDSFDGREVLHVAFGAVLAAYRHEVYAALHANIETYYAYLHTHFNRHITPFSG
jgi:tagaturonate epimerase